MEHFNSNGFQPNLSMQLKTARTVFCYGFDSGLLGACDTETIKQALIAASWEVASVYILQSKRSMKIEFNSRTAANKFLEANSVNVCGIRIERHQIEPEVNPSIDQCYNCGILEPGHTRELCPHPPCCLRCGYQGHLFSQCQYIPNIPPSQYSEHHISQAYCISCKSAEGHCSLNHRACPIKKDIIKKRIFNNRTLRANAYEEKNKKSELSKQIAIELVNLNEWPKPPTKDNLPESSLAMTAIITLAMVEEAHCQGSFQNSLDKACTDNNFPKFKYDLNHDAAVMVVKNLTANPRATFSFSESKQNSQKTKSNNRKISKSQPTTSKKTSLKSIRDLRMNHDMISVDGESDSYASDTSGRQKRPRYSPKKTTNQGALDDIRNRLEEHTFIINVENVLEVGTGIEQLPVKDLQTLYESSNSELSSTRRQIIEALLSQAVEMDKNLPINANIIRVAEDFC